MTGETSSDLVQWSSGTTVHEEFPMDSDSRLAAEHTLVPVRQRRRGNRAHHLDLDLGSHLVARRMGHMAGYSYQLLSADDVEALVRLACPQQSGCCL